MSATTPHRPGPGPETIWARPNRGARGPRPEHSRTEITAAAIALADSGGLPAATMRAVAGALGTGGGALYRYLTSRDELLDLMVDAVLGELQLDLPSAGSWLDDLVKLATGQLALHQRHPWLLVASQRVREFGPHATDYFECCLSIMAELDAPSQAKLEAIAMITGVVSLFAPPPPDQRKVPAPARLFAGATPQAHPLLTAALTPPAQPVAPGPPVPGSTLFERTIRSVVQGLLVDDS